MASASLFDQTNRGQILLSTLTTGGTFLVRDLQLIDPVCHDLYRRLGAHEDPLFAKTRVRQAEGLKNKLFIKGMEVIDLKDVFRDEPGCYLRIDTHWTALGVNKAAEHLSGALASWIETNE